MSTSSDKALKMMEAAKSSGHLNIENPQELMNKLTERYGEKAGELAVVALTKPTEIMNNLGQPAASSAKTLEYLAGDEISAANIQKLGGNVVEATPTYNFEQPTQTGPELSQIGSVDVYGNKLQSSEQSHAYTDTSSTTSSQNNTNTEQSSNDPWEQLFDNLFSGDLGKIVGAAISLQLANQATLASNRHYIPYPLSIHPYRDRIDYFNNYVDNRSKTEKTLDKVADVTYGVGSIINAVTRDGRG